MDRAIVLATVVVATTLLAALLRNLLHRRHAIGLIDPVYLAGVTAPRTAVVFTSPFCHGCREWIDALAQRGATPVTLDVIERPELAALYKINTTPRVAVVETADGEVLGEWDHYTPRAHDVDGVLKLIDIR